jgi:hypothetical protein
MNRFEDTRNLVDLGTATEQTMGIPVGDLQDQLGQYPAGGAFDAD